MKKIVSLFMLLCSVVVLNAQTQIAFLYGGQTYQNGDTIVVTLEKTAHNCSGIVFKNQTHSRLAGLVVTMTEIENAGVEAWGLCTTQCVAELTSAPFDMAPNAEFTGFTIDLTIDETLDRPLGVYDLQVSNGTVTCAVVVRFQAYTESTQGINDVVASSSVSAYPNPAQGQVNIAYSVSQPSTLAVYDIQGHMVRQMPVCGEGKAELRDLPAGIYAYGIAGGKMGKLVVK